MTYKAQYRCRLCGEIYQSDEKTEIKIQAGYALMEALFHTKFTYEIGLHPRIYDIHDCSDGSFGVADFIGMKNVDKIECELQNKNKLLKYLENNEFKIVDGELRGNYGWFNFIATKGKNQKYTIVLQKFSKNCIMEISCVRIKNDYNTTDTLKLDCKDEDHIIEWLEKFKDDMNQNKDLHLFGVKIDGKD